MPYTAGTQAADANCASVFMGTLDGLLVAAGFTFVDQTGTAPAVCRVYKSPAAANFFGSDWFLSVNRAADTATVVGFRVFELYDSDAHLAFNYAPSATSGLSTTATFAISDAIGKAPNATNLKQSVVDVNAAGFGWQVNATPDRLIVATRAASADSAVYAGLYDDLHRAAVSPFPLCVTILCTGSVTQAGASTREPSTPSASGSFLFIHDSLRAFGYYNTADDYSGGYYLARLGLVSARNAAWVRGLLRDVWMVPRAAGINGDRVTATIGGVSQTLTQFRDDFVVSGSVQPFAPAPGATAGALLGTGYGPPWDDGSASVAPPVPTTGQIWPRGNP